MLRFYIAFPLVHYDNNIAIVNCFSHTQFVFGFFNRTLSNQLGWQKKLTEKQWNKKKRSEWKRCSPSIFFFGLLLPFYAKCASILMAFANYVQITWLLQHNIFVTVFTFSCLCGWEFDFYFRLDVRWLLLICKWKSQVSSHNIHHARLKFITMMEILWREKQLN